MGYDQGDEYTHYENLRWRERENVEENFTEIMAENFPNLRKEMNVQIEETEKSPTKKKPKKSHTET